MTTYTTITNAEIDQDSPITQPLLTALRDNPVAITEGAAGAPKVQAAALDTFVGTAPATITGLDNYVALNLRGSASLGSSFGSTTLITTIEFSDDGGSTWAASTNLFNESAGAGEDESFMVDISINLQTGDFSKKGLRCTNSSGGTVSFGGAGASGTIALPTGAVNAIRIADAGSGGSASLNVYGG